MLSACCVGTSKEMNYDLNTFQCRETCPHIAEYADALLCYRARRDLKLAQIIKGVEDSWLRLWYWSLFILFIVLE